MGAVAATPWAIKGAIGVLSDAYPLLGYHKASYIMVSSLIGSVAFALLAGVVHCFERPHYFQMPHIAFPPFLHDFHLAPCCSSSGLSSDLSGFDLMGAWGTRWQVSTLPLQTAQQSCSSLQTSK
jgi:hypothetical protein